MRKTYKLLPIPYKARLAIWNTVMANAPPIYNYEKWVRINEPSGIYNTVCDVIDNPSVSIIIPNKDQISLLKQCLESVLKLTTYANYELVIIENNSEDAETFAYYEQLEKNPKIRVLRYLEKGFNYSKIINFGVNNCSSDYIVQLNNDTKLITPNWLELMLGFAQRPDVGAVGVTQYMPDSKIRQAGHILCENGAIAYISKWEPHDKTGADFHNDRIQNVSAVSGFCVMTRKELYERVGYMDENLAQEYNDIDFCMKLRAMGLLIVYNPLVEFIHYESKTRGRPDTPEKRARYNREVAYFKSKWKKELKAGDPYFRLV
jgi:GT2 family glycosyltransferase